MACRLSNSAVCVIVVAFSFICWACPSYCQSYTNLTAGVSVSGSVGFAKFNYYRIDLHPYQAENGLVGNLTFNGGRADLYLAYARFPTLSDYDYIATKLSAGRYSLVVSNPSNFGAYYFGVYGFSSTPSYELVANFDATINVTNAQIIHNVIQDVDAYQYYSIKLTNIANMKFVAVVSDWNYHVHTYVANGYLPTSSSYDYAGTDEVSLDANCGYIETPSDGWYYIGVTPYSNAPAPYTLQITLNANNQNCTIE